MSNANNAGEVQAGLYGNEHKVFDRAMARLQARPGPTEEPAPLQRRLSAKMHLVFCPVGKQADAGADVLGGHAVFAGFRGRRVQGIEFRMQDGIGVDRCVGPWVSGLLLWRGIGPIGIASAGHDGWTVAPFQTTGFK